MLLPILIVLLVLFLALIVYASFEFIRTFTTPKIYDYDHEFEMLKGWGFDGRAYLEETKPQAFSYTTSRGYTLRGNITMAKEKSNKFILIMHGYTSNQITVLKVCEIYRSLGFNTITYDHRFHGISDKTYIDAKGREKKAFCSMGYYESLDLIEVVDYLQNTLDLKGFWGLHGESMGSGTIMLASTKIKDLDFIVEDCGYATLREEMYSAIVYKKKLPGFPIVDIGNLIMKLKYNIFMGDIKPIEEIKKLDIPCLFVHGDSDVFVPTKVVYKLYEAKKDKKSLHVFKDCVHAKSAIHSPEEYRQTLEDFFNTLFVQ